LIGAIKQDSIETNGRAHFAPTSESWP